MDKKKSTLYKIIIAVGALIAVGGFITLVTNLENQTGAAIGVVLFIVGFFVAFGGFLGIYLPKSEEKKKAREEYLRKRGKIVKATIIGEYSKKNTGSAISRGIIGGALLGLGGAIGGATSGKETQYITFLVEYESGERTTMQTTYRSPLYNELIQYIEM